ncbi:class I SAM-dependent methyltransferase [Fusibacter bizertensis]|uniref:Class I SAM-dependent methyltransferase n=1 Tax=Fusibacter bizertensis TaxID=1488331 RepID=A0ABT6N8X2_9FIRM|nr:class I SAM-dependent methyltransferase [Fusibacter bizertensis]MDH8676866.1 class I SAM-dependent methyltransferase [Fusibacter bizertensis]
MEIKSESIEDFYNSIDESARLKRKHTNQIEFLTTVEYLNKCIKPNSSILDACAGGGIYSFYFSDRGHQVDAGDLVEKNVADIISSQKDHSELNDIFVGSILDLHKYEDEKFDVVLNLGSHYHLTDTAERNLSFEESIRVLKTGGIIAIAYVNQYANIIKFREMFTGEFELLDDYMKNGFHSKNKVFYCTTPELIEKEIEDYNLEIVHHIATDGMKFIIGDVVNELPMEKFKKWMAFHLSTCEDRSILGASEHGLIIAKKV